jgi:hypothetical protein
MPRTSAPPASPPNVVGKSAPRSKRVESEPKVPALPLPHERDETTRRKAHPAEPVIDQARRDLEEGQQDTDLRDQAAEVFDRRWSGKRKP